MPIFTHTESMPEASTPPNLAEIAARTPAALSASKYFSRNPFICTPMTLGEFRSSHHHAGYEGDDSDLGYLVELPRPCLNDGQPREPRPSPKVWIDEVTFRQTYHWAGRIQAPDPAETAALNELAYRPANRQATPDEWMAELQAAHERLSEIRAQRGLDPIPDLPPGAIPRPRTAPEHDLAHTTTDAYRVSIPRGFQTDPQTWSDTSGQAMAGANSAPF